MISLRPSEQRGHADHGWLDTRHTFSFADYYDPKQMGFRSLRVINQDQVKPGKGFGTHPHRDMEIVSYVLEGSLQHKDNMGNGSVITPGDVQRMTAGTGVLHSEFNPSEKDRVHFLQIWLLPERDGLQPGYEQKRFSDDDKRGRLRLIASHDGREGSVTVHQDANVYAALLSEGQTVTQPLAQGRGAWIQVIRGVVDVNGKVLNAGDGASVEGEPQLTLTARQPAEVLLFDLA